MGWMNRLLGHPPETVSVRDLARGFAATVAGRTPALIKLLEAEGLAGEALRTRFVLNPDGFGLQCLLFLAFPFYSMMASQFPQCCERLRREFVTGLIETTLGQEKLTADEFADAERLVIATSANTMLLGRVAKREAT